MRLAFTVGLLCLAACSRGSYEEGEPTTGAGGLGTGGSGAGGTTPLPENGEFALRAEFDGPCERQGSIDVNLGHAPEAFVRAAYCQITGNEPDAALVTSFAEQLRTQNHVRRVDVVRSLCQQAARQCTFTYSDPWATQVDLTAPCVRKGTRDVGAVLMFWGDCPGGVNCSMDWANTHALGMNGLHPLFGFGDSAQGYYNPENPGFWRRELRDAAWAGMQFFLLNSYGPDMVHLPQLVDALNDLGSGVQIGLFDDTWGWGRGDEQPWATLPSLSDTEATAQLIYQSKWKAFYGAVPSQHWFKVGDRPFLYFYNAGTLKPQNQASGVIARMKQLFAADFGVEPFVAVDRAFFADPGTEAIADGEFTWNTFTRNEISQEELKGTTLSHFMAKWDSVNRDRPGELAGSGDRVIKGPELLTQYLEASATSNLAVIATWNDLGEGTGIARNYDYYYQGEWIAPNGFLDLIRQSQCQ